MNSSALMRDQAIRLMTFLARTQELKEEKVRVLSDYTREGAVRWFHSFPEHGAITREEVAEPGRPFLTVQRIEALAVPTVPEALEPFISRPYDDPRNPPQFVDLRSERAESGAPDGENNSVEEQQRRIFESWFKEWKIWAEQEEFDKSARDFYKNLFRLRREAEKQSEEMELVLGVGLLTWNPDSHDPVQRHLYTVPVEIDLDAETGVIQVSIAEDAIELKTELDMLDPSAFGSQNLPAAIKLRAEELVPLEIGQETIEMIGRPTAFDLAAAGVYQDTLAVPESGKHPLVSYSPALILRPRPRGGLSKIFQTIAAQIEETGEVPNGLKPLIDPDLEPPTQPDPKPGAVTKIGDEIFSPLPLNDVQRRILERVDNNAQTLVQGPPGTGKTHTAAALLTHLLAQGKRVLVTAQTDRALYEVRDKLPEPIRPLAVSVIGTGRKDMAELSNAVNKISLAAEEFDNDANEQAIEAELRKIDNFRMERQRLINEIVESYSADSTEQEIYGYTGTNAGLARAYLDDAARFSWIQNFPKIMESDSLESNQSDLLEWLELLRDQSLIEDSSAVTGIDPITLGLAYPNIVRDNIAAVRKINSSSNGDVSNKVRELAAAVSGVPEDARISLANKLPGLQRSVDEINRSPEAWTIRAFNEMKIGAWNSWYDRANNLDQAIEQARLLVGRVGSNTTVEMQGEWAKYESQANHIFDHIQRNGPLPTKSDGRVKIGFLSSSVIKECRSFLEEVTVNGAAPSTLELLTALKDFVDLQKLLQDFEGRWAFARSFMPSGSPAVRVSDLEIVLRMLQPVLQVAKETKSTDEYLQSQGAPPVGWDSQTSVREYSQALIYSGHVEKVEFAQKPLHELVKSLEALTHRGISAAWIGEMIESIKSFDPDDYERVYAESIRLAHSGRLIERRDELTASLMGMDQKLVEAVQEDPSNDLWDDRFNSLQAAGRWHLLGGYLNSGSKIDPNKNQTVINQVDDKIRKATGELAALRAWGNAVRPERLSRTSRASLTHYVQQVRKLGKGTGKYAAGKRAGVQRALDDCRPAVPVWIMPISRIVDQLAVKENLFDVVLIDEASQAGMEATFLQYLAPKIVVIGDDKQVSPSSVGRNQQQMLDLAQQYIRDIKFLDSWKDSTKSLFDDANLRFGGKLTLIEHRRCVPEIINFSNRIAYEPENIQLIPVRQVTADRLAPFKIVYTKHGYQKSNRSSKVNPVEADEVVNQILKCLEDPKYDDLTFGVISLLGKEQANLIEGRLLAKVDALEWERRKLMVGIAPVFQGAERDVMFLSMVAAPEEGHRNAPLTMDRYIQRFNVAVSRAKDQVWIFHSTPLESLGNKEDMRFQLLDYAYGVARQQETMAEVSAAVPHDELIEPFDSLFEQRVYNQIAAKGFTVESQYKAMGYSLDLVISGSEGRIAVECDGDYWHGPDRYEQDLARQRDLERCGWEFFRIRESEYYLDPAESMKGLWEALEKKGIHPSDWVNADIKTSENVIVLDGTEKPEIEGAEDNLANSFDYIQPVEAEFNAPHFADLSASGETLVITREAEDADTWEIISDIYAPAPDTSSFQDDSHKPEVVESPVENTGSPELEWSVPAEAKPEPEISQLLETFDKTELGDPSMAPTDIPEVERQVSVDFEPETKVSQDLGISDDAEIMALSEELAAFSDMEWTTPVVVEAVQNQQLEKMPYEKFKGETVPVQTAGPGDLLAGILQILEVEGPMMGKHLIQTYNQAAGGRRATSEVVKKMNSTIYRAKQAGRILEDNPLDRGGIKFRTYRLSKQDKYRIRELGSRKFDDVSPAELLAVAKSLASPEINDEKLMRAMLAFYGRTSLTEAAKNTLQPIVNLLRQG